MEKPHIDTTAVEVPADLASPALYRVDAAHHPRVDRAEMLRYLGYGGQQIEPELSRRIELVVERLELDIEPRGVRRVFALCVTGAFLLVHFFAYRSVFEYSSLCPWCMIIWLVTIPLFGTVIGWTLRAGVWGTGAVVVRVGGVILSWLPLLVLADYLVIAIAAQVRLDVLGSL